MSATFGHEAALPPLPVPDLDQTLAMYLKSLEPLLSAEDLAATKAHAEHFKANHGASLHAELTEIAATEGNWLERWWDNAAYLMTRLPNLVNTNYAAPLSGGTDHVPLGTNQVVTGATAILGMLKWYVVSAVQQAVPPETMGKANMQLSMFQHLRTYGVCQEPGIECDRLKWSPQSRHIAVMSNNQWFTVDVIQPDNSTPISLADLCSALRHVQREAKKVKDPVPVQALASQDRTLWATQRLELIGDNTGVNAASLRAVETSLFGCVLLDESVKHADASEAARSSITAVDGTQCWADLGYCLMITVGGHCAVNGNHSPADAMTALYMLRWIQKVRRAQLQFLL